MASPLFSKLMYVQIDSSTIMCATDFSLSMGRDVIEIACMNSTSKDYAPDLTNWSISGSGTVYKTADEASAYSIFDMADNMLNSDASVAITLLPDVSSNEYFTGAGYFSSLGMEGGAGSPVTYSFEITGIGTLGISTTA